MILKRFPLLMLTLVLTLALIAPVVYAQNDNPEAADNAFIRFVDLTGAGSVDVYLNGELNDFGADDTGEAGMASDYAVPFGTFGAWMAVPAGTHEIRVGSAGEAMENAAEPLSVDLRAGQWASIVVLEAADGSLVAHVVEEDHSPMLPGTVRMTFFNGTRDQTMNFVRNDEAFVTELGHVNNPDNLLTSSSIPMDTNTYDFFAHPTTEPDNLYGELREVTLETTNTYFLAVAEGPDGSALILVPTRWAETQMLLGNLPEPGRLVETVGNESLLVHFAQAINDAGLTELLSDDSTFYTIFAPTDDAMEGVMEQYQNDSEGLAAYLRDRIVADDLKLDEIVGTETLTTLSGNTLTIRVEGNTVYVNDAAVLTPNIAAMNGTVHIIGLTPGQN